MVLGALLAFSTTKAQTTPGPVEKQISDSVCNCLTRVDLTKVTTKEQATSVIMNCFTKNPSLIVALAEERKVNIEDQAAMRAVGVDVGKNLMKMNCDAYMKLSVIMAADKTNQLTNGHVTQGKLVRIDNKGFNYFVIVDENKKEHSFLWLHQFAGSEKFVNGLGIYAGKKVSITWQETEVFLPLAKGYYNVKEITSLTLL